MHPVVIGMTTLPSRISRIRPSLKSLLEGDLRPDKIIVSFPEVSIREKSTYYIPDFLLDRDFCGNVIELSRSSLDFGPGNKLLGALEAHPTDCYLVVADDDVRYRQTSSPA